MKIKYIVGKSIILSLLILSPFYFWAYNLYLLFLLFCVGFYVLVLGSCIFICYNIEDVRLRNALKVFYEKVFPEASKNKNLKLSSFFIPSIHIIYSTIFGLWLFVVLYFLTMVIAIAFKYLILSMKEQLEEYNL